MKRRHVLMIVVILIFALIMYGVKDAKKTKVLTCSVNSEFYGMESTTTLEISVNSNRIRGINETIDVIVSDEYKEALMSEMQASGKMEASSTKDGIKLKSKMDNTYFDALGLDRNVSYGELKSALELQGYTCEN